MFTEPKIVTTDDLTKRSYITFYLDDQRIREYNGKSIGKRINPNRATSISERNSLLRKLQFEIHKALEANTYGLDRGDVQHSKAIPEYECSTQDALKQALDIKLHSSLSRKYKSNLKFIHRDLINFLTTDELLAPLTSIKAARLDIFLTRYNSSGTYYMNKRRDLGVLFNLAGKIADKPITTVRKTERRKAKAALHVAYDDNQLKPLLNYLKSHNSKLYLCCLMTYATWLRPHEEIRLLTKADFNADYTEIRLSGDANKGGRVRTVFVPEYVRTEFVSTLDELTPADNIFTGKPEPLNPYYFTTQWKRVSDDLIRLKLIRPKQTIYSFRHSAAVQLYKRTKDVYLLQKLLGHSTIVVTLKYLRSLGELNSEELRNAAPQL